MKPIFMVRAVSISKERALIEIHNGGAPVFDIRIVGGRQDMIIANGNYPLNDHNEKIAEIISKDEPLRLETSGKGLDGPKTQGSVDIECTRIDNERVTYVLSWDLGNGLAIDKTISTEVRISED